MSSTVKSNLIRLGTWAQMRALALPLRLEVFVDEQQVPLELEQDEHDAHATHAVLLSEQGCAIATGRLLANGRIGRLAVARAHRRRGLGRAVLVKLVNHAKSQNIDQVWLHAQCDARSFYEGLGFVAKGEPFMEAGIAHVLMIRAGSSPPSSQA